MRIVPPVFLDWGYCRASAVIREGDRSSGAAMGWSETFVQTLKNNDVRFITYVPDNVLTPLIKGAIDA
jgi:hypothetical protein